MKYSQLKSYHCHSENSYSEWRIWQKKYQSLCDLPCLTWSNVLQQLTRTPTGCVSCSDCWRSLSSATVGGNGSSCKVSIFITGNSTTFIPLSDLLCFLKLRYNVLASPRLKIEILKQETKIFLFVMSLCRRTSDWSKNVSFPHQFHSIKLVLNCPLMTNVVYY